MATVFWLWCLARNRLIILAGILAVSFSPTMFSAFAPITFFSSVGFICQPCGLTKRAPDVWESARFRSIFLASVFSTSQTESTPAHTRVTLTVSCFAGKDLAIMKKQVQTLLSEVTKWARSKPEILGVALVGSYARHEARDDSDVDLVLLVTTPQEFINKPEWIKDFGSVKSYAVEDWGLVTSLRVYYASSLEVEYGLTSSEWASEPIDEGTRQVIFDGMQILLDKYGLLSQALSEVKNT